MRKELRYLGWSLYMVACLGATVPLLELAVGTWPPMPSVVTWRFGTAGLLSSAIVLPTISLFFAFCAAALLEHRRFHLTLTFGAGLAGIALLALLVLFPLDALQLRKGVPETTHRAFDAASLKALISLGLAFVTCAVLLVNGIRVWRRDSKRSREASRAAPEVLVQPGTARSG